MKVDPESPDSLLREAFRVDWTPERAQRSEQRAVRLASTQLRTRKVAYWAGSLGTLCLLFWFGHQQLRARGADLVSSSRTQHEERAVPRALTLKDGSRVVLLTADTKVSMVEQYRARLERGSARFEVVPNPARRFRVEAAQVLAEVLGTQFTVALAADGAVRVGVEEGRVRVSSADDISVLSKGQERLFPAPTAALEQQHVDGVPSEGAPSAASSGRPDPQGTSHHSDWRQLAQRGDFQPAYEALKRAGASSVRDDPADLLLSADVARLSNHPSEAVAPLRRVLSQYPQDGRAPVAAYTLGQLLADVLGRPAEGAKAFAQARRLAPRGTLAEDALARSADAWSRAGNAEQAANAARQYLQQYPNGRYKRLVEKLIATAR